MSLLDLSLTEIQKRIETKEATVSQLVEASLARITEVEEELQSFITVDEEGARQRASELDKQEPKSKGLLYGLPVALKDNISTKNMRTTCASQMLADFIPSVDATVVHRLHDAGAVLIGKTNLDEFAMGASTENSSFQITRNPWNRAYAPGGSSGGSAASVAAREVYFSLGSDTGGSIRQPAAFCGVVGLKPTYGLVSRFGLGAYASSMDQLGPLTKNVEDAALVLQVIAGHDPLDSTSVQVDIPDYKAELSKDIQGLRIAVPKEFMGAEINAEVKEKVLQALQVLESLGATWEEVSLSHLEYAVPAYNIISSAEASSNLARYDGIGYGKRVEAGKLLDVYTESRGQGLGSEVKKRIILGTYALSAGHYEDYYLKAQKVRTLVIEDFAEVFQTYDVLMGPTYPTTAFKLGAQAQDPKHRYAQGKLLIPANLAGLPALSLPCGFGENGLPIGLQIMGPAFAESTILRAAYAFEQNTTHHQARPAFSSKGERE